jgi:hypothetical protein
MDDLLPASFATNFAACRSPRPRDAAFDSDRSVRQAILAGLFGLSNGRVLDGLVLWRRQCNDKIDDAPSHFWVANPQKRAIELKTFRRGEKIDDVGLR